MHKDISYRDLTTIRFDDIDIEPADALPIEKEALPRQPLSRRWVALCFALTFTIYLLFVPQIIKYNSPPTGDQPYYLMDTLSLVQDGDLELSNNYANHDEDKFYSLAPHPSDFVGMSAPYPLTPQMAQSTARPLDEIYGYHLPGLGALMVPAWIIGSWFDLWWPATIVFMCILGALVATNIFLFAYETTGRTWVAWAVWAALAFSSPIMSYSYLIFTELPVGLVTIYAFRRLALGWKANGPGRLALVGACIAFIPWLALRCLPIAIGLFIYACVQWWRSTDAARLPKGALRVRVETLRRVMSRRAVPMIGRAACFLAPMIILAILLIAYNIFLYNSIIPDTDERGGSGVGTLYMPWQGEYELKHFVTTAFGILFSQNFGLLTFTPVYLLAVIGVFAMFHSGNASHKRMMRWVAVVGVPYMALIATYSHWGGDWCPPARYAASVVPLLAAPMGASLSALAASKVYKAIFGIFAAAGFAFMSVMLYNPITMWSANGGNSPILDWLATGPVNLDLRAFLPHFYSPDEVWFPWRTGWLIVVCVLVVLLGVLLLIKHDRSQNKRNSRGSLVPRLSVSFALVLPLVLGWGLINYDFLRAKTTFEYVNHWNLPVNLINQGAIAYLDGRIYIPQFGQRLEDGWDVGQVGVLDVTTGEYSDFHAVTSDGGTVAWQHPASVVVGKDGYLYVLNNGEGDDALLVMDSSGLIVRRIALEEKTILGKGLYFGEDGTFYVADQLLGTIFHYAATGGKPLETFTGVDSILNNPRGVAADASGNVYTSETFNRIQKLSEDDTLIAQFDLYCTPRYFASSSESDVWIDATCRTGLLSINTKDNFVQLAQYTGDGPRPNSPMGLAYGPDNLVYVTDGNVLLAYSVRH